MEPIKLSKTSELKKRIGDFVDQDEDERESKAIFLLDESLESTKFKITIEEIEQDFYIDKKGVKWVREKKK